MGEIGALLMVIGPFASYYTGALALVGLILVLIAFNGLADYYKERRIFTNVLYGGIIFIVGAVIAIATIVISVINILKDYYGITNWTDPTAYQNLQWQNKDWTTALPSIVAIIAAVIILYVLVLVAAILTRRSLNTLSEKSGIHMFNTTGLIMLIGAAIPIIGLFLIWIALILLTVSFFQLRTEPTQQQTAPPPF